MPVFSSFINGGIQGGEVTFLTIPNKSSRGSYPTIYLHAAGATNANFLQNNYAEIAIHQHLARELATPVVTGLLGGDTFANDTAMARIDAALSYINSAVGTNYTKFHLFGTSMGASLALRYASLNPTKVVSLTGVIPLTNLISTYEGDLGGLRASIGTAWGVTYPTPLPAGADLVAQAPVIANAKIPCQFYYANNDTICLPADVLAMAALTKGKAYDVGALGHSQGAVFAAFLYGLGNGKAFSEFAKVAS